MPKILVLIIACLALVACKKKDITYTEMETAMIDQLCESDQDCKNDIDKKFKEKEFLEGDINNIRTQRAKYLEMKLNEKEEEEFDKFMNSPGTGGFDDDTMECRSYDMI